MSRISRSLSMKLSMAVLVLAISVYIVTAGILFIQSRNFIRQEARERANSVLNTVLQQVRNYMNMVETATNANAWLAEEHFEPDSLMAIAQRIVWLNRNAYGCTIATQPNTFAQYGRYYSIYAKMEGDSVMSAREHEYEYFDEEWYKAPMESGKSHWVDMYREDTKGMIDLDRTLAIYSKPIFHQGKPVGIVSSGLSFRKLSEVIYNVEYPYPNAYFVILDGDGRYLMHPDSTRLFKKTVFSDSKLAENHEVIALGHEMTSGKEGIAHLNINGRYCHVCYRPIPETDWSLALICPTDDVLKGYHRMSLFIGILHIIGIILIVLLGRWLIKRTLAPIGRLLEISKQMVAGHYDQTVPRTDREDAIGQMQNSFATMQQSIEEHIASINATTNEIRSHNKELIHAKKMAEEALKRKTIFVQNVTHQIRTPLNIIKGFAQVLRDEKQKACHEDKTSTLSNEEIENIASMMKHNSQHLNRMVLMLYDSSETGSSQDYQMRREDQVSCNAIVRECIEYTHNSFPNIPVEFNTELPDSTMILTNHLFLMRTIRELLYNSAKYSDGQHIKVSISETETTVLFTFEDVGPGVPKDEQDLIYEFFTKQDDLSEGLGLGLPLAKRHAISLGGNLEHDSTYKEGCRFVVTMPK